MKHILKLIIICVILGACAYNPEMTIETIEETERGCVATVNLDRGFEDYMKFHIPCQQYTVGDTLILVKKGDL